MENATTATPDSIHGHEARLKRLRYRSWHRGCKETDLILGGYCDTYLEGMEAAELALCEALLEEDDAEIWSWLTEKSQPPKSEYEPLLAKMRQFQCRP